MAAVAGATKGPPIRRPVHPALAAVLASCHGYDYVGAPGTVHHGLPSRTLTFVIAFGLPLKVGPLGADRRAAFWTTTAGLTSAPVAIHNTGRQVGIQLGVKPTAARALFGLPAAELAGAVVRLDEVVGADGRRLYDDVAAAGSWPSRHHALERHLLRLLERQGRRGRADRPVPELDWAWAELSRQDGNVRVQQLADGIGWSRRHFTHRFSAEFGLGPKETARVMRFERSRRQLAAGSGLADIAGSCGYADQAHLTRDWQALAGLTPGQWRRKELPFLQDAAEPS